MAQSRTKSNGSEIVCANNLSNLNKTFIMKYIFLNFDLCLACLSYFKTVHILSENTDLIAIS